MRMTELLTAATIQVPLRAASRDEAIRQLLALLPLCDEACRAQALSMVEEREALMSTGVGNGIAMPHGVAPLPPDVDVVAALGVAPSPVDFEAIDDQPVHLVFLVVANEARSGAGMRALARISRLLHNEAFRDALRGCTSAEAAMDVIRDEEARHRI